MITKRNTSIRPMRNRHEIQDKKTESTMYLYGDIGYWGIDHLEFIKELNDNTSDTIHLRADSGGGDIFAARAMKTAIMQHPAKVIGHIDGLAASAMSFLLMGCDEVEIVDGGFVMIHNAQSYMDVYGYFNLDALKDLKKDIDDEIKLHGKINDSIASDYAKFSGGDKADFIKLMDAETWLTASEALAIGLVNRIYDGEPVEGSYDFSVFAKTPEILVARNKKESKRAIEKALRDAGCTNKEAKTIVSKGMVKDELDDSTEDLRDGDDSTQRDVVPEVKDEEPNLIICQGCEKPVDYEGLLIDGADSVKCPECEKLIDREGKVITVEVPQDVCSKLLAKIEALNPEIDVTNYN